MILYIPLGDQVLPLRLTGSVYLRAFDLLMADAGDPTRSQRVGLSLLALGMPSLAEFGWRLYSDRGGLLEMSGAALDLLVKRLPLKEALELARTVALAVLDPQPAPQTAPGARAPVAPPSAPMVVMEPLPDPYEGTLVDGETWPQFAKRTRNGRKPGSEAAMERWRQIDQEFASAKGE